MADHDGPARPRTSLSPNAIPPMAVLRAFEAVGRLGGVRRAAQELGVDSAAVSRHLKALERWAGMRLLERGNRGRAAQLTEEAALYHRRISAALEALGGAGLELTRRNRDQRLLIWCVPGFAYYWLNERLADFAAANPDIDLEVRPTEAEPDFASHDADADIRYVSITAERPAELLSLEIARPAVFPVAAPAVIASLGASVQPRDLLRAPLLHERDDAFWRAWFEAQGVPAPERIAGPRLWQAHLTLKAASRGQGVALVNSYLWPEYETHELVKVPVASPSVSPSLATYVFRARRDRWRDDAILRFRQWLVRAALPAGSQTRR